MKVKMIVKHAFLVRKKEGTQGTRMQYQDILRQSHYPDIQ